jgi:hypothetical protein
VQLYSAAELAYMLGLEDHAALHLACLLAAHPGVRVSSGRRTREHNRDVGGVESSYHLTGRAADLAVAGARARAIARTADAQRVSPGCTGPEEVIVEEDHLHIAW